MYKPKRSQVALQAIFFLVTSTFCSHRTSSFYGYVDDFNNEVPLFLKKTFVTTGGKNSAGQFHCDVIRSNSNFTNLRNLNCVPN